VPIALLLSVFTILTERGEILKTCALSALFQKKVIDITTTDVSSKSRTGNKLIRRLNRTIHVNEDRISERDEKRDQRRSDLVHDKQRKRKSIRDWWSSSLDSLSGYTTGTSSSSTSDPGIDEEIVLFDYNQPAIRSNTSDSTTLNEPTADYSNVKTMSLFVGYGFERRTVIRQTWGKTMLSISYGRSTRLEQQR
jgi:hypothetical protein